MRLLAEEMYENQKLNAIELLIAPVLPLVINGFAVEEGQGDVQHRFGINQIRTTSIIEN